MNKYKIVIKYPMTSDIEIQEDRKDLYTIRCILARDKCVDIGKKIYTLDNIIMIEQL